MLTETERNLLTLIEYDERISEIHDEILKTMFRAFNPKNDGKMLLKMVEKLETKMNQLIRARGGIKIRLSKTGVKRPPKVSWIRNGRCINETLANNICNLGYACDACPWNKDKVKRK